MKRSLPILFCAILATAVLVALEAGCGTVAVGQADDSRSLEGKTWRATVIAGLTKVQTAKGAAATVQFSAGQAGGSGSVNYWGASYTTGPGNAIQISGLITTAMAVAGPQDRMDQEAAYYAALPKATTYNVTETSLTLFDSKGGILVTYEALPPTPLIGTEWQIVGYQWGHPGDETVSSDDPVITAIFGADGTLSGSGEINSYSTKYTTAANGAMTIDPQIISTKMAGPDNYMGQESAYLAALPKTATYAIYGDQLTLRDASGAELAQFTAKSSPTPPTMDSSPRSGNTSPTENPSSTSTDNPSTTVTTGPTTAETEEYAVYSAVIHERFGGSEMIVVSDHTSGGLGNDWQRTVDALPRNLPGCQRETLESFKKNNQHSTALKQELELRQPYVFISNEELEQIFASSDGWDRFYELYPGAQGEMTLSRVGFNATFDQALLYVGNQWHWVAGEGYYLLCTKTDEHWKVSAEAMMWVS
ncbi:MAG TPA: META domain-containing protein [Chloroflexota bacterium]|nr:META domain-containing protein [Chloroflexota bacterium]